MSVTSPIINARQSQSLNATLRSGRDGGDAAHDIKRRLGAVTVDLAVVALAEHVGHSVANGAGVTRSQRRKRSGRWN